MADSEHRATLAKIVTVSDGVAYGTREDRSGATLAQHLETSGYDVVDRVSICLLYTAPSPRD